MCEAKEKNFHSSYCVKDPMNRLNSLATSWLLCGYVQCGVGIVCVCVVYWLTVVIPLLWTELELTNLCPDHRARINTHTVQLVPERFYREHEHAEMLTLEPNGTHNGVISVVVMKEGGSWHGANTVSPCRRTGHWRCAWHNCGQRWSVLISLWSWHFTAFNPVCQPSPM